MLSKVVVGSTVVRESGNIERPYLHNGRLFRYRYRISCCDRYIYSDRSIDPWYVPHRQWGQARAFVRHGDNYRDFRIREHHTFPHSVYHHRWRRSLSRRLQLYQIRLHQFHDSTTFSPQVDRLPRSPRFHMSRNWLLYSSCRREHRQVEHQLVRYWVVVGCSEVAGCR